MTPASIVKVTPLPIVTGPVRLYGLLALVHVVFELIMPLTSAEAYAVPTKVNPLIIITVKNAIRNNFRIAFPIN